LASSADFQHLVAAQKERVWSLIGNGAIVYVCRNGGKMEPDVKAGAGGDLSREASASNKH
jgi:cytochrome P450/NADPH-cytochrome P450 reductase